MKWQTICQLFQKQLRTYGIQYRFAPIYTPQANPVERANSTLKTMIDLFCDEDQQNWDCHLAELIMAINSSRQESTSFSPAYFNFGSELTLHGLITVGRPLINYVKLIYNVYCHLFKTHQVDRPLGEICYGSYGSVTILLIVCNM